MTNLARRNGWYVIGLAATLYAGSWWTPHIFHEFYCLFVRILPSTNPGPAKLLECSNIDQSVAILPDGKLLDTKADIQGWNMFSSTNSIGRLRVRLNRSAGKYIFYPRLNGESDCIAVYEVMGLQRRLLYLEHGTSNGWTPIAREMTLCADCLAGGWSDDEFPVELEIVLDGPHAQLWHINNLIFF